MRLNVHPGHATLRRAGIGLAALLATVLPVLAAAPPPQPKDGPGGMGDKSVAVTKRGLGKAGAGSFVFYPAAPAPAEGRPVVVFLHAWGVPNPQAYGGWIDHLARTGALVVFPRFQDVNRTRPADASANAERLLKAALSELAGDPEAKPDPKRVAVIGHLAGAPIAANIAADAAEQGLPIPRLVFAVMPGGIASDARARGIVLHDLSRINPETLVITVIGDRDARAADLAARRLLRETSGVPSDRKLFLRALSDDHGFPALTATLTSPAAVDPAYDGTAIKLPPEPPRDPKQPAPPFKWSPDMALTGEQTTLVSQINNARADSLDYLAYWKTFDLAAAAAFAGTDAGSLKSNARFSDMERWADGWPVKRLVVETPRASPPAATTQPAPAPTAARGKPASSRRP
ncbi:chlorophyllase/cutinase-like alpha/beta fold protein [Methylobacterium sp. J-068]|uniref:poly(ethylene terephthalate) hydrolase family protein n=1 Tax=Methylobacterium sp. J-068 TaxID=2836649 RepID=UPI001FBA0D9A|nr:alpha/beta hydrolase fold domain-containing protein [Methylobacterium sp. J-068]MCJ2037134.1 alpha/beta hydrolase fold domain-containing protein [Methylobacterium sp. J-068]